jgi:hypothetical protein
LVYQKFFFEANESISDGNICDVANNGAPEMLEFILGKFDGTFDYEPDEILQAALYSKYPQNVDVILNFLKLSPPLSAELTFGEYDVNFHQLDNLKRLGLRLFKHSLLNLIDSNGVEGLKRFEAIEGRIEGTDELLSVQAVRNNDKALVDFLRSEGRLDLSTTAFDRALYRNFAFFKY